MWIYFESLSSKSYGTFTNLLINVFLHFVILDKGLMCSSSYIIFSIFLKVPFNFKIQNFSLRNGKPNNVVLKNVKLQ